MAWIQKRKKKDGSITYTALIRIKGYPAISATFDRLSDANLWIQENEAPMKKGKHIKDFEAKRHTLKETIDRYIQYELPKRNSDHEKYKMHLTWWKNRIGAYCLCDITPQLISEYRDKLSNEPAKSGKYRTGSTVNRYLASLSIVFNFALNDWGWVEENPVLKVKKKQESKGRVRFLSDDEQRALLSACKDSSNKFLYIAVLMALTTGGRYSEIRYLKWQNIDFKNKKLYFIDTKNGESRSAHLAEPLFSVLKEHSKIRQIDSDFVFPSQTKGIPQDFRKAWEKALKKARIENFRFHDLRHTAASYLAMNGATLLELSQILGHKTLQMVKRYSHLTENHTAKLIEKMSIERFTNLT